MMRFFAFRYRNLKEDVLEQSLPNLQGLLDSKALSGSSEPFSVRYSNLPSASLEMPKLKISGDWNRTGSFVNKPERGWIHPDQLLMDGGVCYGVRYIGCLGINTSMRTLDLDLRSQIAKECINRVCEAAGLKTTDKKRKIDKKIARILEERPNMMHAGSNINLTITTHSLYMVVMESGEVVANHQMPNISFASGGDPDTLDFIAYVAKDNTSGRACFVLECGGGLAQDVITTVGQAFELRFKEYLSKPPKVLAVPDRLESPLFDDKTSAWGEDPEYYNDLPGKIPPENLPLVPPLPPNNLRLSDIFVGETNKTNDDLIDFSSPVESPIPNSNSYHDNGQMSAATGLNNSDFSHKDRFDFQAVTNVLPKNNPEEVNKHPPLQRLKPAVASLQDEPWFHGSISRKQSESLVLIDGDFLVRDSSGSPGQFVLVGMQNGCVKHLLLVDPEGVVRTKDRTFKSVSHLIHYHMDDQLPIISLESILLLKNPILRKTR